MYQHHLNEIRAQQRQQEYEEQAATERSLRALRRSAQDLDAPATGPSYGVRLLTALATRLRAGRARLAQRIRGIA
jgi:hypothetical protein